VKNTGRCLELLQPGAVVYLEKALNPNRKTLYSLITVEKGNQRVNIDSQAPNGVFAEAVYSKKIIMPGLKDPALLRREVRYGSSRFDFAYSADNGQNTFIEVKGVTLEEEGLALFPDAPTIRGVRHLKELTSLKQQGSGAAVFFIIQMEKVHQFSPNDLMHPEFGQALREAAEAGVGILAFSCRVFPDEITLHQAIPVCLHPEEEVRNR